MCSIIKEARKTGIKRGRSPMCRRGGPGNPPRISMKYRIGSVVLFEWRVRLEPWQVAVTLGYQFLYRICGPCTCHSVTQRRSSQCAEAGTPSVARVSRIWFLASLPLLHGGRKERTMSVNEITFERDRRIFSNASTTGIFATSRSCPILYSLETHLNLKVKRWIVSPFFFLFTEASFADKYLLAEKRKEEEDGGESSWSDGRSCWNRWNVYDGALNRSIKRTWRARNARKPGAWLEQKKRLERSVERRTIVTYILISTGVRLRTYTRKGSRYTGRPTCPEY